MREHNRFAFEIGAESWLRAAQNYPHVPEEERTQFAVRMNDLLLFFQGVHALHESGTLEDETYEAYLGFVAASMTTPGGKRYWQQANGLFTRRMVAALDARVKRGDLPNLVELAAVEAEPAS
jgi:hypothetical protein